ncbi:hypothetical protein V490_03517 [Pseudogymnoascus sp. VKM F-3557]|nr:hypothetical protein V490_03517 [Pseudogymnoascus sp. VKM F-3557]
MPDAYDNEAEQHDGAIRAKDIDKYLEHGIPIVAVDRAVKVLDGEKEGHYDKKSKKCRKAHRRYHADGGTP